MAEKETKTTETEESVKEIFDRVDPKEEFFEEKKKSIIVKIINIILLIALLGWMVICLIDFFNTKAGRDPMFCLKREKTPYDDGYVNTCTGLGYKVFNYRRTSFKGDEYGPFWSTDRTADKK